MWKIQSGNLLSQNDSWGEPAIRGVPKQIRFPPPLPLSLSKACSLPFLSLPCGLTLPCGALPQLPAPHSPSCCFCASDERSSYSASILSKALIWVGGSSIGPILDGGGDKGLIQVDGTWWGWHESDLDGQGPAWNWPWSKGPRRHSTDPLLIQRSLYYY